MISRFKSFKLPLVGASFVLLFCVSLGDVYAGESRKTLKNKKSVSAASVQLPGGEGGNSTYPGVNESADKGVSADAWQKDINEMNNQAAGNHDKSLCTKNGYKVAVDDGDMVTAHGGIACGKNIYAQGAVHERVGDDTFAYNVWLYWEQGNWKNTLMGCADPSIPRQC